MARPTFDDVQRALRDEQAAKAAYDTKLAAQLLSEPKGTACRPHTGGHEAIADTAEALTYMQAAERLAELIRDAEAA